MNDTVPYSKRLFRVKTPNGTLRDKVPGDWYAAFADATLNAALSSLKVGQTHTIALVGGDYSYIRTF